MAALAVAYSAGCFVSAWIIESLMSNVKLGMIVLSPSGGTMAATEIGPPIFSKLIVIAASPLVGHLVYHLIGRRQSRTLCIEDNVPMIKTTM